MDKDSYEDHIERYLQRTLSPEEEAAFEELYLARPDVLDELILTEKLRRGFKELDVVGSVERTSVPALPMWRRLLESPQYAAAATVLLGASVLFSTALLVQTDGLGGGGSETAGGVATRLVPLVAVRAAAPTVIDAPADGEWIVLLVDAGFTAFDTYSATIRRDGTAEPFWQVGDLEPTYDQIPVGLPGRLLAPGDYEIELRGRAGDWPAERESEEISRTRVSVTPRR